MYSGTVKLHHWSELFLENHRAVSSGKHWRVKHHPCWRDPYSPNTALLKNQFMDWMLRDIKLNPLQPPNSLLDPLMKTGQPDRENEPEYPRWGLIRSFMIDDGELDECTKQEAFVLGYELAGVDVDVIADHKQFTKLVHAANRYRIGAHLEKIGRKFKFTWLENDLSESWVNLTVYAVE